MPSDSDSIVDPSEPEDSGDELVLVTQVELETLVARVEAIEEALDALVSKAE